MSDDESGAGRGRRAGSKLGSCRVVLLEDHNDTRHLLVAVLRRAGHAVTEAGTIAEAAGAMWSAGAAFDVLVADLELPDGRADPLLRAFKAGHPGAVAIVTSAHAYPRDVRNARAHGADVFLVKPFTLHVLHDALARLADCPPGGEVARGGQS